MITNDSETRFDVPEDQFPYDAKEFARELLRERRDRLLADNPFTPPQTMTRRLAEANEEQDEPLEAPEVNAIVKERPSKQGLVTRENTREFLIYKGGKHHDEDESRDALLKHLRFLNSVHCEEELSAEVLDEIATAIASGTGNGATRVRRFARTLLDEVLRDGVPEPVELVPDVLLKGDAHQIFCGPEQGKTWVALWLISQTIQRKETALFFDMENGKRIVSERLGVLGVDAADEHLHYFQAPPMDLSGEAKADYTALLEETKPELVVFDSWIGCLAACGMDENSPTNVEEWANTYVHQAKARGCTVVILDHVPHDAQRSRGATRKKDLVDVQWFLEKKKDYDRSTVGYVQLTKKKDREAWLPECVGFSIGGTDEGFTFKRSSGLATDDQGDGLTASTREALRALGTFGDQGATYGAWRRATSFKGKEMVDSTFRGARTKLMAGENPKVKQDGDTYYSTTAWHSTLTAVAS
jgi:hypothetical protein